MKSCLEVHALVLVGMSGAVVAQGVHLVRQATTDFENELFGSLNLPLCLTGIVHFRNLNW